MGTPQQSSTRPRQWTIMRDEPKFIDPQTGFLSEQAFRAAVENELAAAEHIGYRLGRGLVSAPIREEVVAGQYETTGWLFRDIFVPAAKSEREPIHAAEQDLPDLGEVVPAEEPVEEPQAA